MQKISAQKLRANRENARRSTGPGEAAIEHTRFNARRHGLYSSLSRPGQDTPENRRLREQAWACLAPRNPLEAVYTANLIETRLQEDRWLEVERTVLTRRPPTVAERPYSCLDHPASVKAVKALARYVAHLSRASEKALLSLVKVRKENWGAPEQAEGQAHRQPEASNPAAGIPPLGQIGLEECLADKRVVLPDEDPQDYEALVREVWATLRPSNPLEEFVASDFIQAAWRLRRVPRIERILFERFAMSDTKNNCGPGFALIQDCQEDEALEALAKYGAALRGRLDRRLELFRKIRKEWIEEPASSACLSVSPDPSSEGQASTSEPQPVPAVSPARPAQAAGERNQETKEPRFQPHHRVTILGRMVQSMLKNIWTLTRKHLSRAPRK